MPFEIKTVYLIKDDINFYYNGHFDITQCWSNNIKYAKEFDCLHNIQQEIINDHKADEFYKFSKGTYTIETKIIIVEIN